MMVCQGGGTRRALVCAVLVGGAGLATAQSRDLERLQVITGLGGNEGSSIGITIEDVVDNDAADEGAYVNAVRADSPAEAGLMAGDVITSLDGRTIDSSSMLRRRLSGFGAGEEVSISVTRAGQQVTLLATLGDERSRRRRLQFLRTNDLI
ncbi:MAG: PDZ domain-containing protein [bacterium]